MEQAADALLRNELIVQAHGFLGRQDVRRNSSVLQERQSLGTDLEALVNALGEHHHLGAVLEQLQDVGRLDAGDVAGTGLAPVPRARAARVQLGVLEGAYAPSTSSRPQDRCEIRGDRSWPTMLRFQALGLLAGAGPGEAGQARRDHVFAARARRRGGHH